MAYKDAYYFPHDSNAKDDPKNVLLIEQLGLEGYGIYWVLIEILRDQPEYRYPLLLVPSLARKYNTTAEKMKAVIRGYGLFEIDEENFFSVSLLRRMVVIDDKRAKAKRAIEIRWANERNKQLPLLLDNEISISDTDVLPKYYEGNTRRERVNETKEKKSKVEESKEQKKYGALANVLLTDHQYQQVSEIYENPKGLIDRVSTIIANARPKNDHYAFTIKVANDDNWPKRRKYTTSDSEPEVKINKGDMSPKLREMLDGYHITKKV